MFFSHNLYALKKQFANLCAFAICVIAKDKKVEFVLLVWNTSYLNLAFNRAIKYVQSQCFGVAITALSGGILDDFEAMLYKMMKTAFQPEQRPRVNELQTFIYLRPCVDPDKLLSVEGHLENFDLAQLLSILYYYLVDNR